MKLIVIFLNILSIHDCYFITIWFYSQIFDFGIN